VPKSNFHHTQLNIWAQAAQQAALEEMVKLGLTRIFGFELTPGELTMFFGAQIAG
jgi:hypothetical protein